MKRELLQYFWNCGDGQIIEFAITRAHLNRNEEKVIRLMFDECMTQEEISEQMSYSLRRVQDFWYSAAEKLLNIPWVLAYAKELKR